MKTLSAAAHILFPVAGRARASSRRPRERGGMLDAVLAIGFAATPLVLLIGVVAETA